MCPDGPCSPSDGWHRVTTPICEFDAEGAIVPNPLFHRPLDKLHSRCIEYPFAASRAAGARRLLDVGTANADAAWIAWLRSLDCEVHATDYDAPRAADMRLRFHRADLRALPFPQGTFDKIIAVSVIEHIGLQDPQVRSDGTIPHVSESGDVDAVRELARVLKPGGALIMTLPFGIVNGLVLKNQARCYTSVSIRKFDDLVTPVSLDYYEYRSLHAPDAAARASSSSATSQAGAPRDEGWFHRMMKRWTFRYHANAYRAYAEAQGRLDATRTMLDDTRRRLDVAGLATWRRVPVDKATATHHWHTDGVVCGVWRKSP